MKTEWTLQFPTQMVSEKCLINSMHLEPAMVIAMSEKSADMCVAHIGDNQEAVCIAVLQNNKIKFFYPDDTNRTTVSLLMNENLAAYIDEDLEYLENNLDEICEEETIADGDLVQHTFNTTNEADAYVLGVEDAMRNTYNQDMYRFIDEELWYKIRATIRKYK